MQASGIADILAARSLLSGPNVSENCFDVVTKPSRVLVAYGPDFSDDRVRLWRLHGWVPLVRWVCQLVQRHIEHARESAKQAERPGLLSVLNLRQIPF